MALGNGTRTSGAGRCPRERDVALGSLAALAARGYDVALGSLAALVASLHRLIRAEQRRGNLRPTVLPIPTVAIDGKNAGTLRWGELCRVLSLEPEKATVAKVRARLAKHYPEA